MNSPLVNDPWKQLRRFTSARIGLGRAGSSLPTNALLDFNLAHAQARDAVHTPLPTESLISALSNEGLQPPVLVQSQAQDRMQYLLRPDLGRSLSDASRSAIAALPFAYDAVFIICDGLSSIAPARHAVPLLRAALPQLEGWKIAPPVIATQARVALGDEIGEMLHAQLAVVLIGERPGLTSPDSMGIYLTWAPRIGRSDAERNCISNIRPEGLPYEEAAHKLIYLMRESRRLKLSGVELKDDSESFARTIKGEAAAGAGRTNRIEASER
jgi:ethanolamine ammonia-lyase small subunit